MTMIRSLSKSTTTTAAAAATTTTSKTNDGYFFLWINFNNNSNKQHEKIATTTTTTAPTAIIVSHLLNIMLTYVLLDAAMGFENNTKAMAFYGVYHREPYNQLIHFFGVPGIIYSLYIFQCYVPITNYIMIDWLPYIPRHCINWATIWFLIYTFFYVTIDVFGSVMYFPFSYLMYASAVRWVESDRQKVSATTNSILKQQTQHDSASHTWTTGTSAMRGPLFYAAMIHTISWYAQIKFGHQMIEGAQPALMQSIGGAFSTAPLFAFYEGVWYFGLQKQFHTNVMEQVAIYTKELCSKGIQMTACQSL